MLCFLLNIISDLPAKIVIARNRILFTSDLNINLQRVIIKNN